MKTILLAIAKKILDADAEAVAVLIAGVVTVLCITAMTIVGIIYLRP